MNVQIPQLRTNHSQAANRAGGSSFYLAMRILSREKRAAMFEVYSFCREVDDIADEDRPRPRRLELLSEWRQNIAALYSDYRAMRQPFTRDQLDASACEGMEDARNSSAFSAAVFGDNFNRSGIC